MPIAAIGMTKAGSDHTRGVLMVDGNSIH